MNLSDVEQSRDTDQSVVHYPAYLVHFLREHADVLCQQFNALRQSLMSLRQSVQSLVYRHPMLPAQTFVSAVTANSAVYFTFNDTSLAILPSGPTTQGRLSAFQLLESRYCQVLPSSNETSEPFGPTAIQALSAASQATAER
jgi:hypothetical protein